MAGRGFRVASKLGRGTGPPGPRGVPRAAPGQPGYSRAQFGDLGADGSAGGGAVSLDLILDVGVTIAL
ncbi:MAG: hypothetical protein IBJ17_06270 [Reyranella sp.]|nr:hypothetical protein [Reyranella sp.]